MSDPSANGLAEYRVLARKYRPKTFDELVGHETLVRTLSNAFASGRIAHAFMLTGVRGIGKTTTARLIARALNCVGADGQGGPTMNPCGVCEPCRSIAEDRHPDVIEMDAASRTGVDDIRELIEGVRYHPVSARYKVYIIDEVHMLSRQAFNALLKTLEEPPPDIKFVFATTEINKVPITVLSRCQRYTLPRLSMDVLTSHYRNIAALEHVAIEEGALALIARSADGSVRDGLSILDQAIVLGLSGTITAEAVRDMLGVADRGLVYDLFESIMAGDAAASLSRLESLYNGGTDPAMVIQELLEITHTITRCKLDKQAASLTVAEDDDRRRGFELAPRLGIAALSRSWQILLKGLGEVQAAPHPLKAAEMVLVRLVYVTDLPPPGEIVKLLQSGSALPAASTVRPVVKGFDARAPEPVAMMRTGGSGSALPQPQAPAQFALPQPQDFNALAELIAEHREGILHALVYRHVRLVRFAPGHLEFQPTEDAPRDLPTRLSQFFDGRDRATLDDQRVSRAGCADAAGTGASGQSPTTS